MNLSHETRDTLAYDVGPVEPALLETTISDNLRLTVEEHGEREALVDVHHGRRWTYASSAATCVGWPPDCIAPESGQGSGSASGARTVGNGR